jgi:hypothetical protein
MVRTVLLLVVLFVFALIISNISARKSPTRRRQVTRANERIDCFPDAGSPYAGYSKQACLARNCLYDDNAASGTVHCYLSPNYGYVLQGAAEQLSNGLRLKLKRNSAVGSMFKQPIENVLLDVQHYTNDIIRFRLYDADSKRYEVSIPMHTAERNRLA